VTERGLIPLTVTELRHLFHTLVVRRTTTQPVRSIKGQRLRSAASLS
jgi:hypothetical protein